jgi:hypothetical protein
VEGKESKTEDILERKRREEIEEEYSIRYNIIISIVYV